MPSGKHSNSNRISMEYLGVGCVTVIGAEEAALAAAKIFTQTDQWVFAKVLAEQTNNVQKILVK